MSGFSMREYVASWNTGSADRVMSHYAEDAELQAPGMPPLHGRDAIRQSVERYLAAFEDVNGAIETAISEGERSSALVRITGKNVAPFEWLPGRTVPATNRTVDYQVGVFIESDAAGKIKRELNLWDNAALLEQLGVPMQARRA